MKRDRRQRIYTRFIVQVRSEEDPEPELDALEERAELAALDCEGAAADTELDAPAPLDCDKAPGAEALSEGTEAEMLGTLLLLEEALSEP